MGYFSLLITLAAINIFAISGVFVYIVIMTVLASLRVYLLYHVAKEIDFAEEELENGATENPNKAQMYGYRIGGMIWIGCLLALTGITAYFFNTQPPIGLGLFQRTTIMYGFVAEVMAALAQFVTIYLASSTPKQYRVRMREKRGT